MSIHLIADAAVETRSPPAVVDGDLFQRVLPVIPQPVTVQPGIKVLPRQHLGPIALTRGEPVDVDPLVGQRGLRALHPAIEREVLAPSVETCAGPPRVLDHSAHASIPAREQTFHDSWLTVVIPKPNRFAVFTVRTNRILQFRQPSISALMIELRCPLERCVRLGYETTDAHRALDVASTGRLPTGFDDFLRHGGDLQNIVIGFCR